MFKSRFYEETPPFGVDYQNRRRQAEPRFRVQRYNKKLTYASAHVKNNVFYLFSVNFSLFAEALLLGYDEIVALLAFLEEEVFIV